MTLSDDHDGLPGHAARLVGRMERLPSVFVHGRVSHDQHLRYAERAERLADHLRAAIGLADVTRYASAFVSQWVRVVTLQSRP